MATIDQTIQYGQTVKRDSEYKYTKVVQNTGVETVAIANASQVSTFEIPVVAFNLAKSFIKFQQTIELSADTFFNNAWVSTPPFQRVELYTRAGVYLMDVTNFANVYQAFGQRTKTIEDFHGADDGLIRKTLLNDLTILKKVTGLACDAAAVPPVGALTTQWRIEGRELYNTVLSLDKTILVGEVLNLRITWLANAGHGYRTDNAAGVNPVDLTANVSIANLSLYLAQETNPAVINELSEVVSTKGMSVLIPFIHSYKTNLTGTSNAISLRFSRGHGISLERIYTSFVTGAEGSNTRYNADVNQFISFYSLLDSKRMQEFDITVANQDYHWMKRREQKERVVSLAITNDQTNFAHSDDWCGGALECARKQHISGLSLDQEKKYDLYVTKSGAAGVPATINYYSIAICQKQLMMGPAGVQVM
jgi:hypothetical protein